MIVEGTFVLPVTILLIAAILGLMVLMYEDAVSSFLYHMEELEEAYEFSEITAIRVMDKLKEEAGNVSGG